MAKHSGLWLVLVLGAGLVGAGACSSKVTVVQRGDDDVPVTTTHHTWTTTTGSTWTTSSGTTSSWTTSSWTTTTATGCDADISEVVGASADCNVCVGNNCCAEAEDFVADPTADTFTAMSDCAIAGGAGPCGEVCLVQVCGGGIYYQFFMTCGDCVNANCCVQWAPCENDASCLNNCIYGDPSSDPACCQPGSLFHALDDCLSASCANECGPGFCYGG
jgi:hypothetical protein